MDRTVVTDSVLFNTGPDLGVQGPWPAPPPVGFPHQIIFFCLRYLKINRLKPQAVSELVQRQSR